MFFPQRLSYKHQIDDLQLQKLGHILSGFFGELP